MRQLILAVSLVVAVPLGVAGQTPPETFDACPTAAQDALRSARSTFELTGIALAMAVQGNLNCAGAVGYADSATSRAMLPTTMMRSAASRNRSRPWRSSS
jgi:CubicO group peptidase (beta-lactamase class C family)